MKKHVAGECKGQKIQTLSALWQLSLQDISTAQALHQLIWLCNLFTRESNATAVSLDFLGVNQERWEQCCASQRDEIEDTFLFTKLSFFHTLRLFLTLSSHDCIKIIDYMNMRMNKLFVFVCFVDFSLCPSGYYYCLVLSTTSCPTSMNLLRGLPVFLPGSFNILCSVYSVSLPFLHWNHCSYYKVALGSNTRLNIINLLLKQPLA